MRIFLTKRNITEIPRLQLIVYKKIIKKDKYTSPHVDTGPPKNPEFRFNILLDGYEHTEMVWWNIKYTDNNPIFLPGGFVVGSNNEERCKSLGIPDWSNSNLTSIGKYASFVKVDILHSLYWDGSADRIILSLRFSETSWDHIENMRI